MECTQKEVNLLHCTIRPSRDSNLSSPQMESTPEKPFLDFVESYPFLQMTKIHPLVLFILICFMPMLLKDS